MSRKKRADLDDLIAEATVDCYNDSECVTGFYTMLEDNLAVPFHTEVLGVDVVVTNVNLGEDDQITAVCTRGRVKQHVSILDLPIERQGLPQQFDRRLILAEHAVGDTHVGEGVGLTVWIRDLAEEGRTMLLVTHEMKFARDVSSHVIYLHKGLIEEEGPPARVFGSPRSERCRQFVATVH